MINILFYALLKGTYALLKKRKSMCKERLEEPTTLDEELDEGEFRTNYIILKNHTLLL